MTTDGPHTEPCLLMAVGCDGCLGWLYQLVQSKVYRILHKAVPRMAWHLITRPSLAPFPEVETFKRPAILLQLEKERRPWRSRLRLNRFESGGGLVTEHNSWPHGPHRPVTSCQTVAYNNHATGDRERRQWGIME